MRGRTCNQSMVLFLFLACALPGCADVASPLDLNSPDPAYDQTKIAGFYSREAHYFRLKAHELSDRALVYESLFGPDSEWVKGAHLLERFYEESAEEQERLANSHLGLAGDKRSAPRTKPLSP